MYYEDRFVVVPLQLSKVASLFLEGQVLADGLDELHLQAAGAFGVSLVASPYSMLQLAHLDEDTEESTVIVRKSCFPRGCCCSLSIYFPRTSAVVRDMLVCR